MVGKYAPLERYLRDLPAGQREVTLDFGQIERMLNDRLPSSAYEDRRWWDHVTEADHVTPRAWSSAGWRVEGLDVEGKGVRLVRIG